MIAPGLARRYTKALFHAAVSADVVDAVGEDLALIARTLKGTPDLALFLGHPRVGQAQKQELVQKAFAGQLHELTLRFLTLVLKKRRQEVLAQLAPEYSKLVAAWRNQLTAQVRSAVGLTEEERKFVGAELSKLTGRNVVLEERVEPGLLGGMIIRYGDKQIDGSVRHHLEQLRGELKSARIVFD